MVQSTQPRTPSRRGAPVFERDQPTPANLSSPLLAILFDRSSWPSASRLTQKFPARCINGQARDVFAGQKSTSGGESETELNDWQVIPTGASLLIDVTTVTPVQNRPRTSRKCRASESAA